jgi:hypothetical protein
LEILSAVDQRAIRRRLEGAIAAEENIRTAAGSQDEYA